MSGTSTEFPANCSATACCSKLNMFPGQHSCMPSPSSPSAADPSWCGAPMSVPASGQARLAVSSRVIGLGLACPCPTPEPARMRCAIPSRAERAPPDVLHHTMQIAALTADQALGKYFNLYVDADKGVWEDKAGSIQHTSTWAGGPGQTFGHRIGRCGQQTGAAWMPALHMPLSCARPQHFAATQAPALVHGLTLYSPVTGSQLQAVDPQRASIPFDVQGKQLVSPRHLQEQHLQNRRGVLGKVFRLACWWSTQITTWLCTQVLEPSSCRGCCYCQSQNAAGNTT